jgi:2-polyprenyl-6-methoxyphenol hydroxylase-like FAD-dependent oxidoreductase
MLKIGIVGAGPAGLYFALLMKRQHPDSQIHIVEQNPAGATYGWGIVFSARALGFLGASDPASYADLRAQMQSWNDQVIGLNGQVVRIDGFGFSGMARLDLLRILQDHCRRLGVEMTFETRLTDLRVFADADLIVGADGANSMVRQLYAEQFQPSVELLSNHYVWYGTPQTFDALSLLFREYQGGAYVAHAYPYSQHTSTFIVECAAQTWQQTGLEAMSEEESRAWCERVFAEELQGKPLLTNRSLWLNFKVVANQRWSHDNVVLLGDALRSVHFSIGSGTRMALEDAIALYHACQTTKTIPDALAAFGAERRPSADQMLDVAARSYRWYEQFGQKMKTDPLPFAYDYLLRSGQLTHERLRGRAPKFMAAYDASQEELAQKLAAEAQGNISKAP